MSVSLRLHCNPSAALCAAVLLVHLVAAGCAWLALPGLAFVFVATGLLLSCRVHWGQMRLSQTIDWRADGLRFISRDSVACMQFDKGAAPTVYWGVLHVKDREGRAHRSVIVADCADANAFRRLRAWLRWHSRDIAFKAK